MQLIKKSFPIYRQLDQMDCGPTCLRMIASYYGKHYKLDSLRKESLYSREGVSLTGIRRAAEKIGFNTNAVRLSFQELLTLAPLPCILHWNQNHFIVIPPQDLNADIKKIQIADPARGLLKIEREAFQKAWINSSDERGVAMLLEPDDAFFSYQDEKASDWSMRFLLNYLRPYRKSVLQLVLGMFLASLFSLVLPFLTQHLVDYGINSKNVNFVYLILISQLTIFIGSMAIEVIRGWLLLYITGRINITIISDFLIKLLKLPISYFDSKMVGDINQRISDHQKIERFLSISTLNSLFAVLNLFVFSAVLLTYGWLIFTVFSIGSSISVFLMLYFQRKRKDLDYERFLQSADSQNKLFEIITGIQEIKLNGGEIAHRLNWERIQSRLFNIKTRALVVSQYQTIGSGFFNQLKNIIIAYISAREVIDGQMSLGMMLSVTYIIGQTISPIDQLLSFFQNYQDAQVSIERLGEIHQEENEEKQGLITPQHELDKMSDFLQVADKATGSKGHDSSPALSLKNVSFGYNGSTGHMVLEDINLDIPFGKTTAIVGASGSGKTTLVKLLLKFYEPNVGTILLGNASLSQISPKWWWQHCGVVMSDGYIFSGTIEENIAITEPIDPTRLQKAIELANIQDFIRELPLGVNTKIGQVGNGISSGQRQRIMIARAIYREPEFLFLDEATSTLDANNEKVIVNNLTNFTKGRTVIVVAHRLSTVRNADQIIVLKNGKIVEAGDHQTLTGKKGEYYTLVKNQLELGK
ncbi:peptidase domain-containing ABC transporter [Mucilaginibacter sp. Bleaf8]|uniref:peptidase domain-containing ABC transporter n=1 Tax=Mucilaginibacter sp. Bleaf8 TaxID=2834430 RepID=UPI001BCEDD82|nr:peptidase domain-containing ABC transporter [Mucilaginibacter sp. Bleaf8]MBS7565721.1 peptidase domain-containing ABC transporter [Mucilaginibacter sp. Bleaf8]